MVCVPNPARFYAVGVLNIYLAIESVSKIVTKLILVLSPFQ